MGHYAIKLEDNIGNTLQVIHDSMWLVDEILIPASQKLGGLLQYVDPYGDTIFNGLQTEALLPEIDGALLIAQSKEAIELLEALKRMAIRCIDDVHLFIKFYGD